DFHVTGVQTCALPISVVNGRRVLVAVPGDEVPYRKALEWGLVVEEPVEVETVEPKSAAEKGLTPKLKKAKEPKKTEGPKLSSYRSEERRVGNACRAGG